MYTHTRIVRAEINKLENEMSVAELIDHITQDNTLMDIDMVLESIALERIIDRTQDIQEIIKRGEV
tara:strand:+ start:251 stop:448 length:198 start_codon:yes stop_codon:yes gene_type:complete